MERVAIPMSGSMPRACRGRHAVRGQALLLVVVSLVVLCLGLLMLFNTGQAVNKKVQLVNTADAAAYSVAVAQARAFNTVAYLNRAEVANEIAVAQMVSLYSWMNYLQSGIDHFKDALNIIGYVLDVLVVTAEIGVMLNEVATALGEVGQLLSQVRRGTRQAFDLAITGISEINSIYSQAQRLVMAGTLVDAPKVATSIVSANAADSGGKKVAYGNRNMRVSHVGLVALEAQVARALGYVKRYVVQRPTRGPRGSWTKAGADRYVNVVMEARDEFTRGRRKSYVFGWIQERNGTDMVDYKRWVGVDTLNFHVRIPFPICVHHCSKNVPLAWGGAAAVTRNTRASASLYRPGINRGRGWDSPYDLDHRRHYDPYNGALGNRAAGSIVASDPAAEESPSNALLKHYQGLTDYDDIVDTKHAILPYHADGDYGAGDRDVGPIFTVQVEQPIADVHTSSHVAGIGRDRIQLQDRADSNAISAIASAQIYFSRPRSGWPFARQIDDKRELGNLFSPYWQARLVDTPASIRAGFRAGKVVIP